MAATLNELLIEIQELVEKLEVIGFGTSTDSVTHNGQTRTSIAAAIKSNFDAVNAMVQGRKTFETLAALNASGQPSLNSDGYYSLAEVWNDSASVNGIYGWDVLNSEWVFSKQFSDGLRSDSERIVAFALGTEIEKYKLSPDDESTPVIISGTRMVLSYNEQGQMVFDPSPETLRLIANGMEFDSGVGLYRAGKLSEKFAKVFVSSDPMPVMLDASRADGGVYRVGNLNLFNASILYHLVNDGQSQSVGSTSIPALSITPLDNVVMPIGGVKDVSDFSSFLPAVESGQESPAFGMAENIIQKLNASNYSISDLDVKLAISSPGVGGTHISQYIDGGDQSWRWKKQVSRMAISALNAGFQYQNHAFTWSLGGSDMNDSTTYQDYLDNLILLRQQREDYLTAVLNRPAKLHCIAWQNGARVGRTLDVPNAQYQASLASDFIHVACPYYQFQFNDAVHLTNISSKALGHYFGRVYNKVVIEGRDWKPFHPTQIKEQAGNKVKVDFHVPSGSIEFDRETIKSIPDEGFEVWDDTGRVTILSVDKYAGRSVVISLSRALADNPRLSYAESYTESGYAPNGDHPRGTLRDTAGVDDKYIEYGVDDGGNASVFELHNYCITFNEIVEVL